MQKKLHFGIDVAAKVQKNLHMHRNLRQFGPRCFTILGSILLPFMLSHCMSYAPPPEPPPATADAYVPGRAHRAKERPGT